MPTNKIKTTAYIDAQLKEDAEKLARLKGKTLSNYIGQLIKEDVERAKKQGEI